MARFTALCLCVCAVFLCLVFVDDAEAKRGFSFGRKKSGGSSQRAGYYPKQQYKPPPPAPPQPSKDNVNRHFLDSERAPNQKPQTNTGPVGFEHFQSPGNKPQTNTAPIGFENFQNPANKPQTPIGFDNFNKKPNVPSAPAMPVPHQNVPNAPGIPNANTGFNQPFGGSAFPSNQYPGKVNNPYQTNPNYAWDSHGNNQFKPSNSYPNPAYPNSGYPHNPSQSFGNNYYNPNTGYPSFPNNYFGNSHHGAPNSFGSPNFGNSYNPQGNSYFPGGGYGHGGYPGQFGYNNYKPKSKFGFGGLPIPIPIPIPIPFGGFGFGGLGGYRNNHYSHRVLDTLQNTTSLNSTANATSIYVVNNVTIVSCTNELFTYGPVNMTVTTCTADNCTSVKLYVATNSSVNHATLTMCLGPNVTVTSNSSDAVKPEVSNISSYWQMICALTANTTVNGTTSNTTTTNVTEPALFTTEANQNVLNSTSDITSIGAVNLTDNANSTGKLCEILNCSSVVMCLPETAADSVTKKAYKPCVRIKMCKSPSTPISHHVTLNTTVIKYEEVDNVVNKTEESFSLNNITVLAFYPIVNNCSTNSTGNDTSCYPPIQPLMNATGFDQVNSNSTGNICNGSDGASLCNTAAPGNGTSSDNSTSSVSPELLKVLETEASKYNTSLSSLLQYIGQRDS